VIRRVPWWAALGLLALAARLAWRFGADEPLLYSHQYHYWEGALRIVIIRRRWLRAAVAAAVLLFAAWMQLGVFVHHTASLQ
jgi:hypothetical protein